MEYTKELFEDLYINKGMSMRQIATHLDLGKGMVDSYIRKFEIPKRSRAESITKRFENTPRKKTKQKPRKKTARPWQTYELTEDNWEIQEINLRADRKGVKCLFIDGERVRGDDRVSFICKQTGEEAERRVFHFIQNPTFLSKSAVTSNTSRGRKQTEEAKRIIGEKNSGERIDTYFDFTCPVCGETFKYRDIQRNRIKKYCSKECQKTAFVSAPEFKGKMNKLEEYFCTILDSMGYKYKTQHLVKYYMVDFFFEDKNLIIQVDGDYWHTNPVKYPEGPTSERQIQNFKMDKKFKNYIDEYTNYNVMRIWESEINGDVEKVKRKIKKALN